LIPLGELTALFLTGFFVGKGMMENGEEGKARIQKGIKGKGAPVTCSA